MHDKKQQLQMTAWWQSPLGVYLTQTEQRWLQSRAGGFNGYFQLQLGGDKSILPELSRPCCQSWLDPRGEVNSDPRFLPFKSDSIDQLLIQHMLEFAEQPHQLLREADRVLAEDGKIIVFCFNPMSLWGLKRLFNRRKKFPWQGHFFSRMRLKDWLVLLDYDVVESRSIVFQPPMRRSKMLQRFAAFAALGQRFWPYFGAVTVLVAKKRSVIITPIRPAWKQPRLFSKVSLTTRPLSRETKNGSR